MKIFICEDDPKQRENMVTIIKNYIMIEEKPMEIALATDNPYEVLEQAKNMNDIGCYFLDIIQLVTLYLLPTGSCLRISLPNLIPLISVES
jgi:two-component system response regulator AgrA